MTRAVKSPVKRIVQGRQNEYVVEVRGDILILRPLRTKKGGKAEVAVKWDSIYIHGFVPATTKKRKMRRSVL